MRFSEFWATIFGGFNPLKNYAPQIGKTFGTEHVQQKRFEIISFFELWEKSSPKGVKEHHHENHERTPTVDERNPVPVDR